MSSENCDHLFCNRATVTLELANYLSPNSCQRGEIFEFWRQWKTHKIFCNFSPHIFVLLKTMKRTKFEKYVSRYKDLVYSQAFYFTGDSAEAQDITQEVLLKFWHHLESLSSKSAKSWLIKVTRNLCIDHSRKRREIAMAQMNASENGKLERFELENVDDSPDPEVAMERIDLQERLRIAIGKLPEKIRETIILREIQGFTYEEIAEALDIPLNSVKVYLHRGRKSLIKYLKPLCEE